MADILEFKGRRPKTALTLVKIPPVTARTTPYPPAPPQPRRPSAAAQRASLMRLTGTFFDVQVHAAINDKCNNQSGYWVLTYPAIATSRTVPYSLPVSGRFIATDDFHAAYEATGEVLDHSISNHLDGISCTPSDPLHHPEIFRRRLLSIERVMLRGIYAAAAQIPRPFVEQNNYILRHEDGSFSVISQTEARLRIRVANAHTGQMDQLTI